MLTGYMKLGPGWGIEQGTFGYGNHIVKNQVTVCTEKHFCRVSCDNHYPMRRIENYSYHNLFRVLWQLHGLIITIGSCQEEDLLVTFRTHISICHLHMTYLAFKLYVYTSGRCLIKYFKDERQVANRNKCLERRNKQISLKNKMLHNFQVP